MTQMNWITISDAISSANLQLDCVTISEVTLAMRSGTVLCCLRTCRVHHCIYRGQYITTHSVHDLCADSALAEAITKAQDVLNAKNCGAGSLPQGTASNLATNGRRLMQGAQRHCCIPPVWQARGRLNSLSTGTSDLPGICLLHIPSAMIGSSSHLLAACAHQFFPI